MSGHSVRTLKDRTLMVSTLTWVPSDEIAVRFGFLWNTSWTWLVSDHRLMKKLMKGWTSLSRFGLKFLWTSNIIRKQMSAFSWLSIVKICITSLNNWFTYGRSTC
eukprot:1025989-Amorphochlora_amoeboformis.AAC.1